MPERHWQNPNRWHETLDSDPPEGQVLIGYNVEPGGCCDLEDSAWEECKLLTFLFIIPGLVFMACCMPWRKKYRVVFNTPVYGTPEERPPPLSPARLAEIDAQWERAFAKERAEQRRRNEQRRQDNMMMMQMMYRQNQNQMVQNHRAHERHMAAMQYQTAAMQNQTAQMWADG